MPIDREKGRKSERDYRNRNKLTAAFQHRQREKKANKRTICRDWFAAYKATVSCSQCGFSHPGAMDFHHRDASEKRAEVGYMVAVGISIPTILAEIAKCDVLCANCHRILHYEERSLARPLRGDVQMNLSYGDEGDRTTAPSPESISAS